MRKCLLGFLILGVIASTPLLAADLSGDWQLDFSSQKGQAQTWTMMTFTADGDNLTIDAVHPFFGNVSGTGTLAGDKITMNFVLMGGNGPVVMDFEGAVKDGKMEGTRKFSYGPPTTGSAPEGAKGDAPPGGDRGGSAPGSAPIGAQPSSGAQRGSSGGPAAGGTTGGKVSDVWTAVRK